MVSPVSQDWKGSWSPFLTRARLVVDFAILVAAYWAAFAIRFEGALPARDWQVLISSWPLVAGFQFLCLACYGIPAQVWRYVGFLEVRRIFFALLLASTILAALNLAGNLARAGGLWGLLGNIPRGVLIIDFVL